MTPPSESAEIRLTGISASPGICIGKAYLVDTDGVEVVDTYFIFEADLEREKKRFQTAVKKAKDELKAVIRATPEEFRQNSSILETHVVLLEDKMLFDRTLAVMTDELINAEWALKKVVSNIIATFKSMDDSYFKERANDIIQVTDRIMRKLIGVEGVKIEEIAKRVILVAHDLSPADTSQINLERVMGFITDRGGKASHTSIIARTLEIPAVQGLNTITRLIRNDDLVIVDGTSGLVIIHPTETTLVEFEERKIRYEERKAAIGRGSHLPAETADGRRFMVMGNIELPEEVVSVRSYGGDGVGLYRTEFQYMNRPDFPSEEELYNKYRDVIEVMGDRPVIIRTLDINGDKAMAHGDEEEELNPALGLRAIRYCLKKPDVFKIQLRAILRAATFGQVRILIPMIASVDEIIATRELLVEAAAELKKEKIAHNPDIAVGIMIEVPAAVILADHMAKLVDFFSIGTNDLIQYTLAIDRSNLEVAGMYNALHPAHIRMIKQVTDVAHQTGIPVTMCGEMAAEPSHAPVLMGLGIDELSMNPQSIPAVKAMIRHMTMDEARTFADSLLDCQSAETVADRVQETYGSLIEDRLYED